MTYIVLWIKVSESFFNFLAQFRKSNSFDINKIIEHHFFYEYELSKSLNACIFFK